MKGTLRLVLSVMLAIMLLTSQFLVFADTGTPPDPKELPVINCKELIPEYTLAPNVYEFTDISKSFTLRYYNNTIRPLNTTKVYEVGNVLLDWKTGKAYKINTVESNSNNEIYFTYIEPTLQEVFASFVLPEASIQLTEENMISFVDDNTSIATTFSSTTTSEGDIVHTFSFDENKDSGYIDDPTQTGNVSEEKKSDFKLDGDVQLVNPRFNVVYDIGRQEYDISYSASILLTAKLEAFTEGDFIKPDEKVLCKYNVPILNMGRLEAVVKLSYGGTGKAKIVVEASQKVGAIVGLRGRLKGLVPDTFDPYFTPTVERLNVDGRGSAEGSAYVQVVAKVSVNVLGFDLGHIQGTAGASAKSSINAVRTYGTTNESSFKVLFEVKAHVQSDAMVRDRKIKIFRQSWTLLHKEWNMTMEELWNTIRNDILR